MVTTPIFVNTCVVFVRLYWFEKRFENIGMPEIPYYCIFLEGHRTLTISPSTSVALTRQPSRARAALDAAMSIGNEERGVAGREIKVLHADTTLSKETIGVENAVVGGIYTETTQVVTDDYSPNFSPRDSRSTIPRGSTDTGRRGRRTSRSQSPGGASSSTEGPSPVRGPRIPRIVEPSNIQPVNPPPQPTRESDISAPHIAFAETPCNSGRALRIPGPREFEKGDRAHEVDDEDDSNTLYRARTTGDADRGGSSHAFELGSPASRTISLGNAATGGSSNMRMRRVSTTVDRFLPRASTVERVVSSAFAMGPHPRHRNMSPLSRFSRKANKEPLSMPYLSYTPTVGRNSQFVDLTEEQRDELGGIEYRSLKLLAKVLVGYYLFFHLFGVICLVPWIHSLKGYKDYVISVGVDPTWWGIYTSQTMFNDLGFTLTPDSMISFQRATFVLLITAFLIVIGNTGFPCMLRLIIWIGFKICPENSAHRESLNFLLDHPRRCFTLLFPSGTTWILFWILVILNTLDVLLFIVLDLNDSEVTNIPLGSRIMGAIFQAVSTRTSGTSVVNLADLHPAIQVSYMCMFPFLTLPGRSFVSGS